MGLRDLMLAAEAERERREAAERERYRDVKAVPQAVVEEYLRLERGERGWPDLWPRLTFPRTSTSSEGSP